LPIYGRCLTCHVKQVLIDLILKSCQDLKKLLLFYIMPARKYYRKIFQKDKKEKKIVKILKLFWLVFFVLALSFFLLFLYYGKDLPRPEKFSEKQLFQPTKIYDRSGKILLYQIYGEERRELFSLKDVPEYLKQAVIAAEDTNFYHHFGLDFKGMVRALLVDLRLKKPIQGGSTITQQLVRSSFLTNEKTIERKTKEIILTLELERRYSKDQILEFYLNQIPFGQNCYGAQSASKSYFKKPVSELSLAEAAVLAALIRAPNYLSPYKENLNELLFRKDYVLDRMVRLGYLEKSAAEAAKKETVEFTLPEEINPFKAPHFTLEVKKYLIENYGENYLKQQGFKVYTSLNWELQTAAEKIIEEMAEINKNYNAHNASLVAIDPWSGEILAMVGSKNYFGTPFPEGCKPDQNECLFSPQFNIVTLGKRQPGSAFKPFAYLTAFEKGFTPNTILWDVETDFDSAKEKEYIPQNYDEKFRGLVSFRQALAQSLNVPSIKVLYLAGLKETLETAKKLGITTLNQPPSYYGLSLVLGGGETNLLEMVSAYGVFATEGYKISPVSILKIEDSRGNVIRKNDRQAKKILKTQYCRLINDILSDNEARAPMFGRNSLLYFKDYKVAAKTGTTENFRDGWVIGYTPSISVGIWVGNNDNSPMSKKPGVVVAGSIFHQFMEIALKLYPPSDFTPPQSNSGEVTLKPVLKGEITEPYHSILHYIKKEDVLGNPPLNPESDPQYAEWEKGIEKYLKSL